MNRRTFLRRAFGAAAALYLAPEALAQQQPTVVWPTGTFVHEGVLDLGVVRDSVLNSTNDFQVFREVWENTGGLCQPLPQHYALVTTGADPA